MDRRTFLTALAAASGTLGTVGLAGCGRGASAPGQVRYWGISGDNGASEQLVLDAFKATDAGRDVTITKSIIPSNGAGDASSVITAVRGRTAPDVWFMDRFSGAQYAALGLLEPIDDMIREFGDDPDEIRSQYMPFAVNELTYDGQLYGLPTECDTRVLFYNRTLLTEAGLDPDELDVSNGPPTVQRIMEMSDQLTKTNDRGDYTQLGLIPWDGEGWGITWAFGAGATWYDDADSQLLLTDEPVRTAYEFLYDTARRLDFPKVDAFKATYQPPNAPPAQTSFYGQQQGFQISGNFNQLGLSKYVPDLDFGVTYLPVFNAGDEPYTWSGGYSLVCPKGSSQSRDVWEFMKFYAGPQGQSIYMPKAYTLPTHLETLQTTQDPVLTQDLAFYIDQLQFTQSRPPLPVTQLWWDSMSAAQENVKLGSRDAKGALEAAQARVQPQMDLYAPFSLPEGYGQKGI